MRFFPTGEKLTVGNKKEKRENIHFVLKGRNINLTELRSQLSSQDERCSATTQPYITVGNEERELKLQGRSTFGSK